MNPVSAFAAVYLAFGACCAQAAHLGAGVTVYPDPSVAVRRAVLAALAAHPPPPTTPRYGHRSRSP